MLSPPLQKQWEERAGDGRLRVSLVLCHRAAFFLDRSHKPKHQWPAGRLRTEAILWKYELSSHRMPQWKKERLEEQSAPVNREVGEITWGEPRPTVMLFCTGEHTSALGLVADLLKDPSPW